MADGRLIGHIKYNKIDVFYIGFHIFSPGGTAPTQTGFATIRTGRSDHTIDRFIGRAYPSTSAYFLLSDILVRALVMPPGNWAARLAGQVLTVSKPPSRVRPWSEGWPPTVFPGRTSTLHRTVGSSVASADQQSDIGRMKGEDPVGHQGEMRITTVVVL